MKLHSLCSHTLAVAFGSLMFAIGAFANDDYTKMDINEDGMISAAEYDAGVRSKWSKLDPVGAGRVNTLDMDSKHLVLDADKDGMITSAEYESGSRSMFSEWDTNGDGNLSAVEIQAGDRTMSDKSR